MQTPLSNFEKFGNKDIEVKLIQKHSVNNFEDIKSFFMINQYAARVISVDGGHDFDTVYSDIILADLVGTKEAHLYLDDIYNQQWPGVIEAAIAQIKDTKTNWAPIFISSNKMILCRKEMHVENLNFFKDFFSSTNTRQDKISLCGWEVISL